MQHQKGFSLVEIAIVMVIVGLLLGGALKGREMINSARIKRALGDVAAISAAIFSYQDRYRALPGDDRRARLSLNNSAVSDGNGNGLIQGAYDSGNTGVESRQLWWHLRSAGLIAGNSATVNEATLPPQNPWGGSIGVSAAGINGFVSNHGNKLCLSAVPGEAARALDIQEDDGIANSGAVRGHASQAAYADGSLYELCWQL